MTNWFAASVQRPALAILLLFVLAFPALAAPTFPELSGRRVVDEANLLQPAEEAALTEKLAALEQSSSDQLVVVTVPDLQGYEIEEYGYQLGRHWGIGQSETNNGVLLIVAPNERKVRIEVGYGLEGILTDALSSVIIQERILPRFRADDYPGGIVAGVDALVEQLSLDPAEAQARAAAVGADRGPAIDPAVIIFLFIFLVFIFPTLLSLFGMRGRRGRRGRHGGWVWTGSGLGGGGWGGGGGWSSGGGGGFSGGGGSFGGGGSSGGW